VTERRRGPPSWLFNPADRATIMDQFRSQPGSITPPQDLEAEGAVLGAMMVTDWALHEVLDSVQLDAEEFYRERHRTIFRAITRLHERGEPVDALTTSYELERRGELEDAGGKEAVSELASTVPVPGNARHHAEIVRAHSIERQVRAILLGGLNGSAPAEVIERLRELELRATVEDPKWLESSENLLREPDPGPTPFAIERLLVAQAIGAIQGRWKVGKTWLILELAIAIVTGRPAFGVLEVERGPVIVVLEESGRTAYHRRLDQLRRAAAIRPEELRDLHFAANRRVRLDDPSWQARLLEATDRIRPVAIFLDPLARLKVSGINENSRREMEAVRAFMRDLRDTSGAAVVFSAHVGHLDRDRMRGTSDLEGYWESKIALTREDSGTCTIRADHREAESSEAFRYRPSFDGITGSLRLEAVITKDERATELRSALLAQVGRKPGRTTEELRAAVHKRRDDVASQLAELEKAGAARRAPSQRQDAAGRRISVEGWFPASDSDESEAARDALNVGEPPGAASSGPRDARLPGLYRGREREPGGLGRGVEPRDADVPLAAREEDEHTGRVLGMADNDQEKRTGEDYVAALIRRGELVEIEPFGDDMPAGPDPDEEDYPR